ncbi:MAG: hypothetical protein ACKOCA_07260 [Vulcanococcus sp.]|nr:hypothetical protein [Cyanobacteria bacterium M_DeepCast_200m_mx_001]MBU6353424.1 hypothetical protein [Cyanobacteria bacterium REEB498]
MSTQPLPSDTRSYVDWARARQRREHAHQPVIAQRQRTGDGSEAADVHAQEQAWAERHAHERRLHASALAQLRHG